MALSPSIPTSFVPKQPVATDKRRYSNGGNNVLLIVATIILALTIGLAAATFLYDKFLQSEENAKGAQVIAAQKSTDEDTITQLVRLQNRLNAAESVINQHVALSQLFTLLESITVQNVYFNGINITVADDRSATISMTGQAQDFNALAAESNVFASQKYIKSAIFSNIGVNKANNVSFSLTANVDPSVIIQTNPPSELSAPVVNTASTSTPASASVSSTTSP